MVCCFCENDKLTGNPHSVVKNQQADELAVDQTQSARMFNIFKVQAEQRKSMAEKDTGKKNTKKKTASWSTNMGSLVKYTMFTVPIALWAKSRMKTK